MSKMPKSITQLLRAWRDGDQEAGEQVLALLYLELKKIASSYLKRERNVTLQTTELVNEAILRLFTSGTVSFENRAHFFGIIARAMRQILVEQIRKKTSKKRGGDKYLVTLNDANENGSERSVDLLRLDEALKELESFDERKARLVELRFFAGLSIEETAVALELSSSTIKREWILARAWLYNKLTKF